MHELMPSEQEKTAANITGMAIYRTITDPSVEILLSQEKISWLDPHTQLHAGLMFLLTSNPEWIQLFDPTIQRYLLAQDASHDPYLKEYLDYINESGGDTTDPKAIQRVTDLLAEAVDNSLFWYKAIETLDGGIKTEEELQNHPTIASGMSTIDTVHQTVVAIINEYVGRGVLIELPKSRNDFINMYMQAPELFARINLRLDLRTKDRRDPSTRGLCPAQTIDPATQETWLKTLLKVTSRFYKQTAL